jgi:transposase
MVGKRHPLDEVASKLAHADELEAKGKTKREISKALGVSIMTYHRWRKKQDEFTPTANEIARSRGFQPGVEQADGGSSDQTAKRLELENLRLRRLVTDLLLEKMKLEEELRDRREARFRRAR